MIRWRSLHITIQKSHFKSTNIRKLEAAAKAYGGLASIYPEALRKLTNMLLHPFPQIRAAVADELWVSRGVGKGENWSKARKGDVEKLVVELGLVD